MIGYMPEIYPDELLYSLFARYYVHSGYAAYIDAANDIYRNKRTRPVHEFINALNMDVKELLLERHTMEELIEKHTMFPAYGRFVSLERRQNAFKSLVNGEGNYFNWLYIPSGETKNKSLRWCPLCAQEDRTTYGETYWHRFHQIPGVDICPMHKCYLCSSSVEIKNGSPNLVAAEQEIAIETPITPFEGDVHERVIKYMIDVFNRPIDLKTDYNAGLSLETRLDREKYYFNHSWMRNNRLLYDDYLDYFRNTSECIMNFSTIQKILNGEEASYAFICQLAVFENVCPDILFKTIVPNDINQKIFKQIAKELDEPEEIVTRIGLAVINSFSLSGNTTVKKSRSKMKWEDIDTQLLPEVRECSKQIYGDGTSRPRKVTIKAVCRALNLPDKRFDNLPRCKEEILKWSETQEHYWAREVIWAYNKIKKEDQVLNWKKIRTLTNIRKNNFEACLPEIKSSAVYETYKNLLELLEI
ncbi:TniQ family protein [Pseudobutyrivibrio xylanivorans]|uniref:TniQ family protein n=1 Tax=Pseudobutyrivibrio xylanivorans TaxID=185007 RepID=A0A5P6VP49_PSEXY|nr:TniQ family protein [Pseudobutyrivibrio xylanivorans]QFJ54347.1 TniQ family protein [Pseudobutyrivibrio xylanivorans]